MGAVTRDDLKIILKFGVHLARVDGNFHMEEKKVLRKFSEAINLTEEEREELMGGDSSLNHGLGDLSSDTARELLLKALCTVSYVDGFTSDNEVAFIEKVLGKLESGSFLLPKEEWGSYETELFDAISQVV